MDPDSLEKKIEQLERPWLEMDLLPTSYLRLLYGIVTT